MARSRRKNRRSTSQNAASLLALALPAPFQRLANSQLGPMLIFFGLPALLIVGFLQIDWQDGTPQLKVNPQKASELKAAVKDHLGSLENQPLIQQWQQAARQSWNSQPPSVNSPFAQPHYPQQQTPNQPSTGNSATVGRPPIPFPSTNPPTYVSTTPQPQANYQNYSQQQPMDSLQPQYSQQQYSPQQYSQQQYGQQAMIPLQQTYTQPQYSQQQISEQQLYQQRLYEQQLYQQRLYEQQLYEQQLYQQRQQYNQQLPPAPMAQSPSVQPAWRNR